MTLETIVYDEIGQTYDQARRADPMIAKQLKTLLMTQPHGHYIDVGCGTGNYTAALSDLGVLIRGVDISEEMLTQAEAKYPDIAWEQDDARALSFAPGRFDGALSVLAVHHFKDMPAAFRSIRRILKPEARYVMFTSTPEQIQGYWLADYFPQMIADSAAWFVPFDQLVKQLYDAGFEHVTKHVFSVDNQLQDRFLGCGKYRPELYLEDAVRDAISSFRLLIQPDELASGLDRLREDIASGRIREVIEAYESDLGDYLYVSAVASPAA